MGTAGIVVCVVRYMVDNGQKKLLSASSGLRMEKGAYFEMSLCG